MARKKKKTLKRDGFKAPPTMRAGRVIGRPGDLAFFDGGRGLVPVKALRMLNCAGDGSGNCKTVRVKVTGARRGYPRGYEFEAAAHRTFPRLAVRGLRSRGGARLLSSTWEK